MLGPRARRRLVAAGVAVTIAVLVIVGVALTGSAHHKTGPGSFLQSTPASKRYLDDRNQLIFGMTHQQVRRLVGPPVKIVAGCWQYAKYFVLVPHQPKYATADELCFLDGKYSIQHFWRNGKWGDPPTRTNIFG
jgi:hypothetical protein